MKVPRAARTIMPVIDGLIGRLRLYQCLALHSDMATLPRKARRVLGIGD